MKRIFAIGAAVLTLVALASCQMAETSGGAAPVGGRSPLLSGRSVRPLVGVWLWGLWGRNAPAHSLMLASAAATILNAPGFAWLRHGVVRQ